jgi:hypothetical protein
MNSRTGRVLGVLLIVVIFETSESFKYRLRYTVPPPPEIPFKTGLDTIEQYWFTQKLDHFNASVTAVWRQVRKTRVSAEII